MRLFLSEYNVNVNSVNFFLDTSLHLACKIGSIVCIRLLLEYGADTNVKNKAGKKPSEVIGVVIYSQEFATDKLGITKEDVEKYGPPRALKYKNCNILIPIPSYRAVKKIVKNMEKYG